MPTSQELIEQLAQLGLNYQDVTEAIGRPKGRSYIRQVHLGAKPGSRMVDQLQALRDRLAGLDTGTAKQAARDKARVLQVPKRETKSGAIARVRRPRTITSPRGTYSTTTLKAQAVGAGAHGAAYPLHAAPGHHKVAVTSTVGPRVKVNGTSGSRAHGRSVEIELGSAAAVEARLNGYGGDFTAMVVDALTEAGYISYAPGTRPILVEMEIRTYGTA